jgi:hypothetical protein
MKTLLIAVLLSISVVGCGGSSMTTMPTTPLPTSKTTTFPMNGGAVAGFHGNIAKTTTTHSFSVIPKVYAQTTTTVSLTGTFSGYSSVLPPPEIGPAAPAAYPVYGVGSLAPNCQGATLPTSSQGSCPFGVATGSMTAGQALATQGLTPSQGNLVNPAFVTGAGTIGPLVVYAAPGSGTGGGTELVEVWVLRAGTVMSTGISCTLPVHPFPIGAAERCIGTETFSVQDEDQIVGTVTIGPNDFINGLTFFLVKN